MFYTEKNTTSPMKIIQYYAVTLPNKISFVDRQFPIISNFLSLFPNILDKYKCLKYVRQHEDQYCDIKVHKDYTGQLNSPKVARTECSFKLNFSDVWFILRFCIYII